ARRRGARRHVARRAGLGDDARGTRDAHSLAARFGQAVSARVRDGKVEVKVGLVVALLATLFGASARAQGPVYVVDTTEDAVDAAIDGVCATAGGHCSLRAAIMESNHRQDGGLEATILLPAGTYLLTIARGDPEGERNGDLDVDGVLKIVGSG